MVPLKLALTILGLALANGLALAGAAADLLGPLAEMRPLAGTFAAFLPAWLVASLCCLAASGLPAALYERNLGRRETDLLSMWIWLAASGLITVALLLYIAVHGSVPEITPRHVPGI